MQAVARIVVAEINSAAPVIGASPWPEDIPISHRVYCNYPIATIPVTSGRREQESAIAAHLADVIPDGACLQVGIGAIPAAILSSLSTHQHLGIHTGMLGDALYQLIECGAVDNTAKPYALRKTIAGCIYGEQSLYATCRDELTPRQRPLLTAPDAVLVALVDYLPLCEVHLSQTADNRSSLCPH